MAVSPARLQARDDGAADLTVPPDHQHRSAPPPIAILPREALGRSPHAFSRR